MFYIQANISTLQIFHHLTENF